MAAVICSVGVLQTEHSSGPHEIRSVSAIAGGELGMVVLDCSPSPWEVPEGGSRSSTAT